MENKIDRGPIVVYCSKTGFTARYALWIAEKLECPFISLKAANVAALQHYETIIFGGWLKAGKIQGIEFLAKNIKSFEHQNVVVYCTGSGKGQDMTHLRRKNLTGALEDVSLHYFVGGLNYEKMSLGDRAFMKMFLKALRARHLEDVVKRISTSFDESKPENVEPLVEQVKKLGKKT